MSTPFDILGVWFRGFLSIAILCASTWLIYEWQDNLPRQRVEAVELAGETVVVENGESLNFVERLKLWSPAPDWPTTALVLGSFLLIVSIFGRTFASRRLLLKRGNDGLNSERTGEVKRLKRTDGTTLQVELYGPVDGHPIILTHGWSNDSAVWYYVKKQLSGRYRIIVWDLPGHGLSDQAADNDYSVQRFANDLRAVLDYAGPKPAVLLGHSLGGMTVQMFCKLFPEELNSRVSRIILFATTYTNPLKTTRWSKVKLALQTPLVEPLLHLTIWLWPAVWALNWLSYLNGSAHRSTARSSFDGTETKEQLDFSAFYTAKAHPAVMAKGMLGMLRYDVTQSLANMSIPALVIDCANDKVILPEALAFIRSQIPIRSSASLAPARHMGNIEQNERFSQLIDIYSDANSAGSLDKKEIVTASNRFSIVPDKAAI